MLFTRPATLIRRFSLLRQYPIKAIRISPLPTVRFSSSGLPDKKDDEASQELTVPKEKWDPVPQKFLKRLPVEHHGIGPANFNDHTIWYPIFKFPHMFKVHAVVRLKIYVTFISLALCLSRFGEYLMATSSSLGYPASVACVTLFGMYLAGNLCRKLIVQIYVTEDLEYVRLSRFTFFAKRQDIVLPRALLVPLTDSNDTHRKLVLKLETKMPENVELDYDNYEFYDEKFNIVLMFGGIHNEDKFETILGKLLRRIN